MSRRGGESESPPPHSGVAVTFAAAIVSVALTWREGGPGPPSPMQIEPPVISASWLRTRSAWLLTSNGALEVLVKFVGVTVWLPEMLPKTALKVVGLALRVLEMLPNVMLIVV